MNKLTSNIVIGAAGVLVGVFAVPRKPIINAINALSAKLEVQGAFMQGQVPTETDE